MQIKNATYGGERPLFASHGLRMEHVTIQAGESALKECSDIEAVDCRFEGKYPFWHVDGFVVRNCLFTEGARAALWYSRNLTMSDTLVKAPKMFREMDGIRLENVRLPFAQERSGTAATCGCATCGSTRAIISSCTAKTSA